MAEIINKIYGSGLTGYEEVVADLQKLWDFSPIETATNAEGLKTTTLWIDDVTNIKVVQRASYTPYVYVTYKGTLQQIDYYNTTTSTSDVQMYGVKTNRGMVLTIQADSGTLGYDNRYIMIGDAENPHTGDVEKTVGLITGGINTNNQYLCMLASDVPKVITGGTIDFGTKQRNSIIIPFTASTTSFVMKSIYRVVQTQSTLFFGECTFNGRKMQSVGAVLIEDD